VVLFPAPPFGFETAITGINPLVSLFDPLAISHVAACGTNATLLCCCDIAAVKDATIDAATISHIATLVAAILLSHSILMSLRYILSQVCRCDIAYCASKMGYKSPGERRGKGVGPAKGTPYGVQKSISAPSRPLCAANTAITAIWRQVNWRSPTSRCETEVPMPSNKKKNSPGPGCCRCNAVLVGASAHNTPQPPYHEK